MILKLKTNNQTKQMNPTYFEQSCVQEYKKSVS